MYYNKRNPNTKFIHQSNYNLYIELNDKHLIFWSVETFSQPTCLKYEIPAHVQIAITLLYILFANILTW